MSGMRGTKRAAEPSSSSSSTSSSSKRKSRSTDDTGGDDRGSDSDSDSDTGGGATGAPLTSIEDTVQGAVTPLQGAFDYLDRPVEILSAATTCRRWHQLTRADSVWRARFEREGLAEKARLFDVALPVVGQGGGAVAGGGGSSSSAGAEEDEDTLAGVGLAFYMQVFALKVPKCLHCYC
jgi:hypothetical protein